MNTTQRLWHAFAVKRIIRQIVTFCFAPSHLSNAPRLHQFGRLNNELFLQYKSDADINLGTIQPVPATGILIYLGYNSFLEYLIGLEFSGVLNVADTLSRPVCRSVQH